MDWRALLLKNDPSSPMNTASPAHVAYQPETQCIQRNTLGRDHVFHALLAIQPANHQRRIP